MILLKLKNLLFLSERKVTFQISLGLEKKKTFYSNGTNVNPHRSVFLSNDVIISPVGGFFGEVALEAETFWMLLGKLWKMRRKRLVVLVRKKVTS